MAILISEIVVSGVGGVVNVFHISEAHKMYKITHYITCNMSMFYISVHMFKVFSLNIKLVF